MRVDAETIYKLQPYVSPNIFKLEKEFENI